MIEYDYLNNNTELISIVIKHSNILKYQTFYSNDITFFVKYSQNVVYFTPFKHHFAALKIQSMWLNSMVSLDNQFRRQRLFVLGSIYGL